MKIICSKDVVFYSGSDFNISCKISPINAARNCNSSINSIVVGTESKTYVKIFHELESNLEFHMINYIENNDSDVFISSVRFHLDSDLTNVDSSNIVVNLFDRGTY